MSTIVVIVLGILTWVVLAIALSLFMARMNRLRSSAAELSLAPPVGKPFLDPTVEVLTRFPAEPARFVGRAELMAAAGAALAPASGRTAVVFQGMAGAGKTTCAVQLAYRHRRGFTGLAFWSAPTDPDQFGEALRLLAVALAEQLADPGFAMVDEIATRERLEAFLPTLTDAGLLLILDNLDTLLTPDGRWRDLRWASLIGALTGHQGSSRVILTSRIVPAGLNAGTVLIQPVPTLSRDESLLLVRELPNLRALPPTVGRHVLALAQGHPMLLEFAEAAAAEPSRLAFQLAEVEEAASAAEGDAEQLRQTCAAWTLAVTATLPAPARLLLHVLCRIEETDRDTAILGVNWPALWRRVDQPAEPPPLAGLVAALVTAALIDTDPVDPNESVRYRIHPGIVEAIHAATPEPVTAAVDAQLADWWTVVGDWGIEPRQTGARSRCTVRAGLAAARYLLRQHDYDAASCLLERALIRNGYSPVTSLAVIPLLRRIAEATGTVKDLVVLGAAARRVDPDAAELLLRRAYDQAITSGEYRLASTSAGELVTLLRDQGKLVEALTLAGKKIEHTRQAGFGFWTQLSDQGRRLQILGLLGHHEQVLFFDLPALRARMADLPDQRADNDRVNPWNVREGILDIGRSSAVALQRWDDALELNDEIAGVKRRCRADVHEVARIRFNDYLPLLRLGRLTDADQLLRECQDVFNTAGDSAQLAAVYAARAELASHCDDLADAVDLQRTSLRLGYVHPDPREISTAHHNLANYLSRLPGKSAEQRAHRLAAALLAHLTGELCEPALAVLTGELRSGPDAPPTLAEVTHLVDADNGVRFGALVLALCPDPTTLLPAFSGLSGVIRRR
ncbi:MAG: hypothetical protein ACRDSR_10135 [Pseudonocardiaceae bacterium]